jgi:hypothetical protein
MKRSRLQAVLQQQLGLVSANPYDTAWVALVPDATDVKKPAWPQVLQYLRERQLVDGGWGSEDIFYAHGRTINTLAVLRALLEWGYPGDEAVVAAGVEALHHYADYLIHEPYEPIGFEILLPKLIQEIKPFDLDLPYKAWVTYEQQTAQKMALIGRLQPDYENPHSWWFNLEVLSEAHLAEIDDRILGRYGSIAASPSATAAYLRARRLNGLDSPRAARFLEEMLRALGGGAGVCYPIEHFDLIWRLDSLRRAGLEPSSSLLAPLIHKVNQVWQTSPRGISSSQSLPIAEGDTTAVAFAVLSWAGYQPDDTAFRAFWGSQSYITHRDELVASVSANVHALTALRYRPNDPEYKAMKLTIRQWLSEHVTRRGCLHDKWHFSPLYATSRAINAFAGWDNELAQHCIEYLLTHQHENGGWGSTGRVNLEETSYAVLGLVAAYRAGFIKSSAPLKKADAYFKQHNDTLPTETFWIGKSLYQPPGVVGANIFAAQAALAKMDIDYQRPSLWAKPSSPYFTDFQSQ